MQIQSAVLELMRVQGYKKTELANKMDYDPGNFHRFLAGKQGYSEDLLNRLSQALDVPISTLFAMSEGKVKSIRPAIDDDLQVIIGIWKFLPEACRAQITATVKSQLTLMDEHPNLFIRNEHERQMYSKLSNDSRRLFRRAKKHAVKA